MKFERITSTEYTLIFNEIKKHVSFNPLTLYYQQGTSNEFLKVNKFLYW